MARNMIVEANKKPYDVKLYNDEPYLYVDWESISFGNDLGSPWLAICPSILPHYQNTS